MLSIIVHTIVNVYVMKSQEVFLTLNSLIADYATMVTFISALHAFVKYVLVINVTRYLHETTALSTWSLSWVQLPTHHPLLLITPQCTEIEYHNHYWSWWAGDITMGVYCVRQSSSMLLVFHAPSETPNSFVVENVVGDHSAYSVPVKTRHLKYW